MVIWLLPLPFNCTVHVIYGCPLILNLYHFLYILQAINTAMTKNTDDNQSFNLEKTSLDFLEKHDTNLRLAFEQKDYRKALYHIDQALKIASASQRLKLSRYYTASKKST